MIFTGSTAGWQPLPLHALYAATKSFDNLLAEGLWGELRGSGVDVLALEPGPTETEFQEAAGELAHAGEPADKVVRVALRALGQQPSVVSGVFNWLRANVAMRLMPRSLLALVAKQVMARADAGVDALGAGMPQRLVDLSHAIHDGLVTYPGISPPRIGAELTREASRARYAPGTEFHIGRIEMSTNTGTYLDTPFHRFADGFDLAALPLEAVADLPGRVVDCPRGRRSIEPARAAAGRRSSRGRAVLFRTGWSRHFGTPCVRRRSPVRVGGGGRAARRGARRARRHRLAQRRRT